MFRVPKYFIFIFVGLSALTAYFIHEFQIRKAEGQGTLASSTPQELSTQIREVLSVGGNISEKLDQIKALGAKEVYNCQCAVSGIDSPYFQFEDSRTCGQARNYFENALARIPSAYRDERARRPAEFPRVCMTYILRKFLEGTENRSHSLFGMCDKRDAEPRRGAFKPCVTVNYVNSIYNSFGDFTNCFGVPQRDFLPKLYNESGLHMNALGAGFDVGTGQLVGSAIEYANTRFSDFKSELLSSDKEACRNLAPVVKNLQPASKEVAKRCQLILPPENPMLNIFYLMIKYKQDREKIERSLSDPEFNIIGKLRELGLKEKDYDREQLVQMVMILSFNAGARGAMISLKGYLDSMVKAQKKLTPADFDFGNESLIYIKVRKETGVLTRNPKDDDAKWAERLQKFEDMKNNLSHMKLKYKPKAEKVSVKDSNGRYYSTYKLSWKKGELTFPAYLMVYQHSGSSGYLSFVKRAAGELNEVFKEGACVPDSYLSL